MAESDLNCDACGLPPYPADRPRHAESGLPEGWVYRTFGRRTFTLCECCGSTHHFKSGVSAYLQEALGIGPDAICDFGKSTEPGSGLHRLRIRQDSPPDGPKSGADE